MISKSRLRRDELEQMISKFGLFRLNLDRESKNSSFDIICSNSPFNSLKLGIKCSNSPLNSSKIDFSGLNPTLNGLNFDIICSYSPFDSSNLIIFV